MMSLLNSVFHSKKNIAPADEHPYGGFRLMEDQSSEPLDSVFHCMLKGTIIFAATFGCVHGVLSEFEISYNYVLVCAILYLVSMVLSFMHIRKWIFNVGYPVLFLIFTNALFQNRALANSGFQAFINIFNEAYSKHFLLNFTRESTEIVSNRFLTITTMAVFVGIFIAILINVAIFHDMYFLSVFNFTFWPLQLGIYIGQYPSRIALFFVFYAFFATCLLKLSGHYHFIYPGKKKEKQVSYQKNQESFVFYKSSSRAMRGLGLLSLVLALFFSAFCSLSIKSSEIESLHSGSMKSTLDDNVKILVQSGIMGMFNRYEATGGISGGKLGGVRSVRPDYETDLTVTFVPYAFERVYLKAYTGAYYTSTEWLAPTRENGYIYSNVDYEKSAFTESRTLAELMLNQVAPSMSAKMLIENVDASINYLYLPYFTAATPDRGTVTRESLLDGTSPLNQTTEVSYIPHASTNYAISDSDSNIYDFYKTDEEQALARAYKTEAYNNYLSLPMSIQDEINSYHDAIGTGQDIDEQISMIRDFLYSNYTYDMSPGATPYNQDFVTYFLREQKRGYCAHFATAATLLLRSYGIPARYVEGYVIDQTDVASSGRATDYAYEDFFQGQTDIDSDRVISVDISDGNAHAWTEVYIDNFGWIPVDMTPPSSDREETSYSDFLSALSNLLSGNAQNNSTSQDMTQGNDYSELFDSIKLGNSPVIIWLFAGILFVIALPILYKSIRTVVAACRRSRDYQKGFYQSSVTHAYLRTKKKLSAQNKDAKIVLPEDVCTVLKAQLADPGYTKKARRMDQFLQKQNQSIDEFFALTQKCLYSSVSISRQEADRLLEFYSICCR